MIPCFGTQIFAGMTENKRFKINHYKKVLAVWGQLQLKKSIIYLANMYLGYMMESLSIMTQFIYSIYNYTSLKGQVNRELSLRLVFFQPTHQNWTETLTILHYNNAAPRAFIMPTSTTQDKMTGSLLSHLQCLITLTTNHICSQKVRSQST